MRLVSCLAFAGMLTLLGGCEPNQLYMGSRTVVGVNAAVNPEQTKGWLVVGYDRNFAAIVPRSVDPPPADQTTPTTKPKGQEAMTSIACSSLAVKGITIKHYKESMATGKAAEEFAKNLRNDDTKSVKDFFDCFKDPLPPGKPAVESNP